MLVPVNFSPEMTILLSPLIRTVCTLCVMVADFHHFHKQMLEAFAAFQNPIENVRRTV